MPRHPANANRVALVFVAFCWMITLSASKTNSRVEAFSTKRPHSSRFPTSQFLQLSGPCARHHPMHQIKSEVKSLHLSKNNKEYDPRDNFGRSIRGLQSSALKTTVEVGDTVVCKRSLPNQGIVENASYEVKSIYGQYFDEETQKVVKQPLSSLGDTIGTSRMKVYITLFSPEYHSEAVIVAPEEVGLVTVREELGDAIWLAVPGFFWVAVAASFYNSYHERTGGSFGDAFWGR